MRVRSVFNHSLQSLEFASAPAILMYTAEFTSAFLE